MPILFFVAYDPVSLQAQEPDFLDRATYSDQRTAEVITLARARHYYRDSIITSYRAVTTTRFDIGLGRRRFAWIPPFAAVESAARVTWQLPDELRVEILGQRQRSALQEDLDIDLDFDRPWFVPRSVGDSIQLLEGDFPENPALHPLAETGVDFYHYELFDSLTIEIPGRRVRALGIRVQPKQQGHALIAGDLWVDADSYEVVRLTFVFLGRDLWVNLDGNTPKDSSNARRENDLVNKMLTVHADLEYGLYEGEYWLPFRQLVSAMIEVPWILDIKVPARFITTFDDYEINTLPPIDFRIPEEDIRAGKRDDGSRRDRLIEGETSTKAGIDTGGRRWEIEVPSDSVLAAYQWDSEMELDISTADRNRVLDVTAELASIAERLPDDIAGRPGSNIAWEELADVTRFNRVQGFSLGAGYLLRPSIPFTTFMFAARFGVGDLRLMGSILISRDAPAGLFKLRAFRRFNEADPWSHGQSLGNSVNAFFAGHDDADYYHSTGAEISWVSNRGILADFMFTGRFEEHRSVFNESGSVIDDIFDDGTFPLNPSVLEGRFGSLEINRTFRFGSVRFRPAVEAIVGDIDMLRGWMTATIPVPISKITSVLTGRIAARTCPLEPLQGVCVSSPQYDFRIGGPQTVRGSDYGVIRARSIWAVQLDVPLSTSSVFGPVAFFDIGDSFNSVDDPAMGFGAGFSLFQGWLRINGAYAIEPDRGFRIDFLFGAPR